MQYTALGMIETRGLVGCIEAADAATKAAEVHVLGIEFVTGGLVMVRFVGDTSSVQAAVEAGSGAAARVSMLVSTRVISRLDDQVVQMLDICDPPATETVGKATAPAAEEALRAMSTTELRAQARALPDFPVKGRDLNRMSKKELIVTLIRMESEGKGHE